MWVLRSPSTGDHRLELTEGQLARQVLHPAVRSGDESLARYHHESLPDAIGDDSRGLDLARAQVDDPKDDRLVADVAEQFEIQIRLRRLDREVSRDTVIELAQERVAARFVLHHVCVA